MDEALGLYRFHDPAVQFIRHNENITYSVKDRIGKYLLRIHCPADRLDFSLYQGEYDKAALISGEMALLRWLGSTGELTVQAPVPNQEGEYVSRLRGGELLTVLSWIDGETLNDVPLNKPLAFRIGQMMARLHRAGEAVPPLNRCRFDASFVEKVRREMDAAYRAVHLDATSYRQIDAILALFGQHLEGAHGRFTLVHADLSKSNLIDTRRDIAPIDFSMCGYGIPEMDLGDMAYTMGDDALMPDLLAGYRSADGYPLDSRAIGLCRAFSVIAYIAIHHAQVHTQEKYKKRLERWRKTIFVPLLSQ